MDNKLKVPLKEEYQLPLIGFAKSEEEEKMKPSLSRIQFVNHTLHGIYSTPFEYDKEKPDFDSACNIISADIEENLATDIKQAISQKDLKTAKELLLKRELNIPLLKNLSEHICSLSIVHLALSKLNNLDANIYEELLSELEEDLFCEAERYLDRYPNAFFGDAIKTESLAYTYMLYLKKAPVYVPAQTENASSQMIPNEYKSKINKLFKRQLTGSSAFRDWVNRTFKPHNEADRERLRLITEGTDAGWEISEEYIKDTRMLCERYSRSTTSFADIYALTYAPDQELRQDAILGFILRAISTAHRVSRASELSYFQKVLFQQGNDAYSLSDLQHLVSLRFMLDGIDTQDYSIVELLSNKDLWEKKLNFPKLLPLLCNNYEKDAHDTINIIPSLLIFMGVGLLDGYERQYEEELEKLIIRAKTMNPPYLREFIKKMSHECISIIRMLEQNNGQKGETNPNTKRFEGIKRTLMQAEEL